MGPQAWTQKPAAWGVELGALELWSSGALESGARILEHWRSGA